MNKRKYHPFIILMYHSNMLTPEQVKSIPRTTRNDWKRFNHHDYYGYDIAKDYIDDLSHIKEVLKNKHIKQGVKFMCAMSFGYRNVISEIEGNKKLLRKNAQNITYSIKQFARRGNLKITDACNYFGVSKDWFYKHRDKITCNQSILNKCFKQYPSQLTMQEVSIIEKTVTEPENRTKTKTTLYYDAMRKGLITCGLSTFFKYASLVGYLKPLPSFVDRRKKGFRASRAFEWLHVDVTHIQTQNDGVQYVAFIKDNYSKALLGYRSTQTKPNSEFIRNLFIQTFIDYNLFDNTDSINILSDGGTENKGSLLDWIYQIEAPPVVRKLTAKTDEFPFSNSMAESTHRIYKSEFMGGRFSLDNKQHLKDLEQFFTNYNQSRYPIDHYGFTPIEVLNGARPNKHQFKSQIQQARKNRVKVNQEFNQCTLRCIPKALLIK